MTKVTCDVGMSVDGFVAGPTSASTSPSATASAAQCTVLTNHPATR
jgi:hypothetical protein